MNSHFKRWIDESVKSMLGEFSAQMILEDIITKHGTSPYVGKVKGIGWYLSKLNNNIIKLRQDDGINIYKVKK